MLQRCIFNFSTSFLLGSKDQKQIQSLVENQYQIIREMLLPLRIVGRNLNGTQISAKDCKLSISETLQQDRLNFDIFQLLISQMQKVSVSPNTMMAASLRDQYLNLYYILRKDESFKSQSITIPSLGTVKRSSQELIIATEVQQKDITCFEIMDPDALQSNKYYESVRDMPMIIQVKFDEGKRQLTLQRGQSYNCNVALDQQSIKTIKSTIMKLAQLIIDHN